MIEDAFSGRRAADVVSHDYDGKYDGEDADKSGAAGRDSRPASDLPSAGSCSASAALVQKILLYMK